MKYDKSGKSNIFIILLLVLILTGAIVGLLFLADFVGMFSIKETFYPLLTKIGIVKKVEPVTGAYLESEVLAQREEFLKNKEDELRRYDEDLKKKEDDVNNRIVALEQKEQDFMDKEKAFINKQESAEGELEKVKKLAFYFASMKPDESAKILENMPDELVIKILKNMSDQKTVAVIFMKMEKMKAGELLRKMSR